MRDDSRPSSRSPRRLGVARRTPPAGGWRDIVRLLLRRFARLVPTLRARLLLVVNGILVIGLGTGLLVDYRKGLAQQLAFQRLSLEEEARALAALVERTRGDQGRLLRRLRERDVVHEGRLCVVETGDGRMVQVPQTPPLAGRIRRGELAPGQQPFEMAGEQWLLARGRSGTAQVWIAGTVEDTRRAVRRDLLVRLLGLGLLGLAMVVAISLLLLHWVNRPLERLVQAVRRIGRGEPSVLAPCSGAAEFDQLADQITRLSRKLTTAEAARRRELEKARRIQSQLSGRWEAAPGLTLAHLYLPMEGVAGDYYDLLTLKDGTSVMCIADVSGHGVPAAMEAAVLKTLLLGGLKRRTDLGAVLREINRFFHTTSLPEDFASMTLVRWLPSRGQIAFASAGHETGYLVRQGRPLALESTGTLLGIAAEGEWEMILYDARPGERVVLLTDGVVEAQSPEGEAFGRRRVREILRETAGRAPREVVEHFRQRMRRHRGSGARNDDITILVADLLEGEAQGGVSAVPGR